MSLRLVIPFVLSGTVLALPCHADKDFWIGDVPPPRANRAAQACEWLEEFNELDQEVPTLSPAESTWLQREYDDQIVSAGGSFTKRAIEASNSTEYHKRYVRRELDNILVSLRLLCTEDPIARGLEMRVWTALAADLVNFELWQSVQALVDRKVVSAEVSGLKRFPFETHVMWGRTILNRVVVPMLDIP